MSYSNVPGNYYPKYTTGNFIAKNLVKKFLATLDQFVNQIDPSSIHELGCGEGNLITRFVKPGRSLLASDLEESVIQKAREHNAQTFSGIEFVVKDLYSAEAPNDAANLVLCCEVLEHLPDSRKAMTKLYELADPYLVISVPREPIWRILNVARGKYLSALGNTPGHIQHFSSKAIQELVQEKFEIVSVKKPFPWTMILAKKR